MNLKSPDANLLGVVTVDEMFNHITHKKGKYILGDSKNI
jgi:hypothetical protein